MRRARFGFRHCCPVLHQRRWGLVDWILGRGGVLPKRRRFWALAHPPNSIGEGVVDTGEGGGDGCFSAQNELAERGFAETGGVRGGELAVGPAALGADGEGGLPARWLGLEDLAKGQSVRPFGQHDLYGAGVGGEGLRRLRQFSQHRYADAARLLRGFG